MYVCSMKIAYTINLSYNQIISLFMTHKIQKVSSKILSKALNLMTKHTSQVTFLVEYLQRKTT